VDGVDVEIFSFDEKWSVQVVDVFCCSFRVFYSVEEPVRNFSLALFTSWPFRTSL